MVIESTTTINCFDTRELFPGVEDASEFLNFGLPEVIADEPVEWHTCYSNALVLLELGRVSFPLVNSDVVGREVGDDSVSFSTSIHTLVCNLARLEYVYGMKISVEDTSISSYRWNFCEVTSIIPIIYSGSFLDARKSNDFRYLDFVDIVLEKLKINTSKSGTEDYSGQTVGKTSWLKSRMTTRTELQSDIRTASILQDSILRVDTSREPKYLPRIMGGSGVEPDSAPNLFLYVRAYKSGTYQRVYGSATEELSQTLNSYELGEFKVPVLCSRLRQKQEYLHGTYDNYIFVMRSVDSVKPVYGSQNLSVNFQSVENRLLRSKKLKLRSQVERDTEVAFRLSYCLINGNVKQKERLWYLQKREKRQRFEGALYANTAFQRLLDRVGNHHDRDKLLQDEGFISVNTGVSAFSMNHAIWLKNQGRGETFSISDIRIPEDVFLWDTGMDPNNLKVEGIPLLVEDSKSSQIKLTTTKSGLYQISSSMEQWASKKAQQLRDLKESFPLSQSQLTPIFGKDLEWVNDDNALIELIRQDLQDSKFAIVAIYTMDRRLCRRASSSLGVIVYRADPISLRNLGKDCISEETKVSPQEFLRTCKIRSDLKIPTHVYIDTGSALSRLKDLSFEGFQIYRRESPRVISITPKRKISYHLRVVTDLDDLEVFFLANHRRPKK